VLSVKPDTLIGLNKINMSEFNPGEFMVEPTIESFNSLRKDDLVTLGKHLGLEIRSTLRKHEVYDLIKEHFVKEKTFEQSVFMEQSINTVENTQISEDSEISEKDKPWQNSVKHATPVK
jgi:hypothetical protein